MQAKQRTTFSIVEGHHYVVDHRKDLPLEYIDFLGHGGTASVEKVQDRWNGRMYARKIYTFGGSRVERHRAFENEVQVIKRLTPHHHVIQVIATYIAKREVGVILSPVASRGSLNDILQEAQDGPLSHDDQGLLCQSFACLSSGLSFMHTQNVRHKDIKPHNILIHNNSVIFTDFGGSLDHSSSTRSITTGLPASVTQRYAAPEVSALLPRSSKTDIFSLGCVFFEILEALGTVTGSESLTPYRNHFTEMSRLLQIAETDSEFHASLVDLTQRMLNPDRESRPSACDITKHLWNVNEVFFCDKCISSLRNSGRVLPTYEPANSFQIKREEPATLQEWSSGYYSSQDTVSNSKDIFHLFDWEWLSRDNGGIISPGMQEPLPMVQESLSALESGIEEQQQSLTSTSVHNDAYEFTTTESSQSDVDKSMDNDLFRSGSEISSTCSTQLTNRKNPFDLRNSHQGPLNDDTIEGHGHNSLFENTDLNISLGYRDFQKPGISAITSNQSTNPRNPHSPRSSNLRSENNQHKMKLRYLYHCDVAGCARQTRGFTTSIDLGRHKRSVHGTERMRDAYQCALDSCRNRHKVWPRLDNFKQHIERIHPNEDMKSLIERSKFKPQAQEPPEEPPMHALLVGTGGGFSE